MGQGKDQKFPRLIVGWRRPVRPLKASEAGALLALHTRARRRLREGAGHIIARGSGGR